MKVVCPHCDKRLNVPDELAGRRAKCPGCKQPFDLPVAEIDPLPSNAPSASDPFSDQNFLADLPPVNTAATTPSGSDYWSQIPSAPQPATAQKSSKRTAGNEYDQRSTEDKLASTALALEGRRSRHLEGEVGEGHSMSRIVQWVFFAMFLGGPVLAMIGWYRSQDAAVLARDGATAQGVVVGASSSSRIGRKFRVRKEYELQVAWKDASAQECLKNFSVSFALFQQHVGDLEGDEIRNPEIQIRYLPSNPRRALIVGTEFNWGLLLYGGLASFALGAIGFAAFLYYDVRF